MATSNEQKEYWDDLRRNYEGVEMIKRRVEERGLTIVQTLFGEYQNKMKQHSEDLEAKKVEYAEYRKKDCD